MVCTNCYYKGKEKLIAKGSIWIAILLLLLFFPIGIIYIIWCSVGPRNICPKCDSVMISEDSPRGREILKTAS